MSTDTKTILEWSYEPTNFFEEHSKSDLMGGKISVADGRIMGEFDGELYGEGRKFRDQVHACVRALFMAQQVQTHEQFHLSEAAMSRVHPDGRRDVTVFADAAQLKVTAGRVDFVVRNADGEILKDSKTERIQKQQDFRKRCADPTFLISV